MKVMIGHGDGPAHAVGRDDQGDAGLRAGLDVDGVVADAEAGDDGEAAALRDARRVEAMGEQDQRVEILELFGAQRVVRFEERHLDARARCAAARGRSRDRSASRPAS